MVVRGVAGAVTGSIGNFSAATSTAVAYDEGQVIISFGRPGTGFIDINANPTDTDTPYIDIVESGSGGFSRKARLGDLSGLAGTSAVHGNTNPGFGLSSTNVFLEGGIVANTGSIAGVNMKDSQLYIGTGTHGNSNTAFYVSGKDDATAGDFSLGDKLVWDNSTSTLTISGQITLESGGDTVPNLSLIHI